MWEMTWFTNSLQKYKHAIYRDVWAARGRTSRGEHLVANIDGSNPVPQAPRSTQLQNMYPVTSDAKNNAWHGQLHTFYTLYYFFSILSTQYTVLYFLYFI